MNKSMNGKRQSLGWWLYGLAIITLIIGLTGCSSSNNDSASSTAKNMDSLVAMDQASPAEAPMAAAQPYNNESVSVQVTDQRGQSEEPPKSAVLNDQASIGATAGDLGAYDRKLIYNANVVLEVEEYGDAQTKLFNMVTLAGGYMLNFNDVKSEYESGGVFVIKVPSSGFHPFVTKLEELKKKNTKAERSIQGKDVTEEYVDIASRLKAKQVVEARLLSFMEKATDTKNLLQFSNELANVQEEIEAIKGRMRYIDQNVAFSTVEIRMYEKEAKALIQAEKDDNALTRAGVAMKSSGKAMIAMFEGIFVVLAGAIPVLIGVGLIVVLIWIIYRNTRYATARKSSNAYVTQVEQDEAVEHKEDKKE